MSIGLKTAFFLSSCGDPVTTPPPSQSAIYVVVEAGQSNADERAEFERFAANGTYTTRTPAGFNILHKPNQSFNQQGNWQPYNANSVIGGGNNLDPFINDNTWDFTGLSLVMGTGLQSLLGQGIYLVKMGKGGRPLLPVAGVLNDLSHNSTGDFYDLLWQEYFDDGISKIPNPDSLPIVVLDFIWWQGERDASDGNASTYGAEFTGMVNAIRARSPLTASVHVTIVSIDFNQTSAEREINEFFRTYTDVPGNNATLITAPDFTRKVDLTTALKLGVSGSMDDNHSSYLAHEFLGETIVEQNRVRHGFPGSAGPPPVIDTPFGNQTFVSAGTYTIPASFTSETVSYRATMTDGSPLPSWLEFNTGRRQFIFTGATSGDDSTNSIRVTIFNIHGSTTYDFTFTLALGSSLPPVIDNPVPDQSLALTATYQIPINTASDPEGDTLHYSMTMADDSPLPPGWIFNASTRTLTVPQMGSFDVKLIVADQPFT